MGRIFIYIDTIAYSLKISDHNCVKAYVIQAYLSAVNLSIIIAQNRAHLGLKICFSSQLFYLMYNLTEEALCLPSFL